MKKLFFLIAIFAISFSSLGQQTNVTLTKVQDGVEGVGKPVKFKIALSTGNNQTGAPIDFTLNYLTPNNSDYVPVGTASIPINANFVEITLYIIDNTTIDGSKTVRLTAIPPGGYNFQGAQVVDATIYDNDFDFDLTGTD